ncbi:glutamine synthetase family protein [Streptomyces sp. M10(2022)]
MWNEAQLAAAECVEAGLGQVDFVRLVFCDPHGLARSKTLTVQAFRTVLRNGMNFSPGPFIFDTGHAIAIDFLGEHGIGVDEIAGVGNFILVPDPVTFQTLPGSEPRTAWVIGDEYLRDGTPIRCPRAPCCTAPRPVRRAWPAPRPRPRSRVVPHPAPGRRARQHRQRLRTPGRGPRVAAVNAGYQFNLDAAYDSVAPVTDPLALHLIELGLPLRSMEHESGPGQVETTFSPMSALDTADAMLLFRTVTKRWCSRSGHHASFMSQPALDSADPSGWHLNQSVVETATGRNLFSAEGLSGGISPDGKAYADGLLAWVRELCLLSVPTVNGYRRLNAQHSLAPTRVGLSVEDRTAMLRVVGSGSGAHLENRVSEPCANPYLNIAAQLFAGLDGLNSGAAPAQPVTGEPGEACAETVPQTLRESLDAFRSGRAAQVLGAPLASTLVKLKESELRRYEAWCLQASPAPGQVTQWEQREYFGAY